MIKGIFNRRPLKLYKEDKKNKSDEEKGSVVLKNSTDHSPRPLLDNTVSHRTRIMVDA